MDVMHEILRFVEILLLCGVALVAMFVGLIIVAMKMPENNPLRLILTRLAWRFGATGGVLMIDPIVTGLPLAGELIDILSLGFLIYYWYTFFKRGRDSLKGRTEIPLAKSPHVIIDPPTRSLIERKPS